MNEKLYKWQQRLMDGEKAWAENIAKMDHREQLYNGDRRIRPMVEEDENACAGKLKTSHVRNIIFENIESMISSQIPPPKVTARYKEDQPLAEKIEHFIRAENDRIPTEKLNDLAERTVDIQGGTIWQVAWDNSVGSHRRMGELERTMVHPKNLVPQPGINTDIQDMDWYIIKQATTKDAVFRRYDVNVDDQMEADPEVRGTGNEDLLTDNVTVYIGHERDRDTGCINRYVWCNDIELEDLEDYQARRQPVCTKCHRMRPLQGTKIQPREAQEADRQDQETDAAMLRTEAARALAMQMADSFINPELPDSGMENLLAPALEPITYDGGPCPWCGNDEWTDEIMEYEQIWYPVTKSNGEQIPGEHAQVNDDGTSTMEPTLIPFYKPDVFPAVLQKNVSVFGQLMGNSDVDVIEDQQNTMNRLEKKLIDRIMKAGSKITRPKKRPDICIGPEDGDEISVESPAEKNLIDVLTFSGDLTNELAYYNLVYEEPRQILGITNAFQGRQDPTATSGKAKEFSAAQSAGRMNSKRKMKDAAYAEIYELYFKMWLAYADEKRPIHYKDFEGNDVYDEISRYDFLKKDAEGKWYWDDDFLFSVDNAGELAQNREAMWQETRMNFDSGAFGPPQETSTQILFWTKMQALGYPYSGDTIRFLEERQKKEEAQAQAQAQQQMQMQMMDRGNPGPGSGTQGGMM